MGTGGTRGDHVETTWLGGDLPSGGRGTARPSQKAIGPALDPHGVGRISPLTCASQGANLAAAEIDVCTVAGANPP